MDQVIKHFYHDLISQLPMDDTTFRASLYAADLLSGYLKEVVRSKPTRTDKAEHFIDEGINNDAAKFAKLLEVMENSSHKTLITLATKIRNDPRYSGTTGKSLNP